MTDLISTTEQDGFEIKFYALPEDTDPTGSVDDDGETARQIEAGTLQWFIARVTASKAGVELGSDYLGGCAYESAEDFLDCLYYPDMVDVAIAEAREKLAELAA